MTNIPVIITFGASYLGIRKTDTIVRRYPYHKPIPLKSIAPIAQSRLDRKELTREKALPEHRVSITFIEKSTEQSSIFYQTVKNREGKLPSYPNQTLALPLTYEKLLQRKIEEGNVTKRIEEEGVVVPKLQLANSAHQNTPFLNLPIETILLICSYLPIKDKCHLMMTSAFLFNTLFNFNNPYAIQIMQLRALATFLNTQIEQELGKENSLFLSAKQANIIMLHTLLININGLM